MKKQKKTELAELARQATEAYVEAQKKLFDVAGRQMNVNLKAASRAMDIAATLLWQVDLTLDEARDVVNHAKHTALQLFPDKEETFDLIYGSRFRRILVEKYHLQ